MRRALVLAALALAGCAEGGENRFRTQFDEWYQKNPPSEAAPAAADLALLERWRPVYLLAAGAEPPLDFYADYMAKGTLVRGDGTEIKNPSPDQVKAAALDEKAVFTHEGRKGDPVRSVAYGRIDRDKAMIFGAERPLAFLTYTLAFRTSGLPSGLAWWKEYPARIVGDAEDWHQLDHYIAVTIALDESLDPPAPLAATFQEHNYMRTWRLGGAEGPGRLELPPDGRIRAAVARRSNELYPQIGAGPRAWRTVGFLDESNAHWMMTGEGRAPWAAGLDETSPDVELAALPLVALPPADPFYTFRGSLGAKRRIPGRGGPPGSDYNTLAALKPKPIQMFAFYWHEGFAEYPGLLGAAVGRAWKGQAPEVGPLRARFEADWAGEGRTPND